MSLAMESPVDTVRESYAFQLVEEPLASLNICRIQAFREFYEKGNSQVSKQNSNNNGHDARCLLLTLGLE
jgi:hypothetical protein